MKNSISEKYIKDYILSNYGELRHCPKDLAYAIRKVGNESGLNKIDLFHYLIERKNTIPMAQSYGFDTAFGRELRERINYYYHFKS